MIKLNENRDEWMKLKKNNRGIVLNDNYLGIEWKENIYEWLEKNEWLLNITIDEKYVNDRIICMKFENLQSVYISVLLDDVSWSFMTL